jgi:hypothetical protein
MHIVGLAVEDRVENVGLCDPSGVTIVTMDGEGGSAGAEFWSVDCGFGLRVQPMRD